MTNKIEETKDDVAFETMITRALEQQPSVAIPAEFAARVRASLPAQPRVRTRRSVGRIAAAGAGAALVVGLCWLAPHVQPSFESVAFDVEMLMLAELAGVATWLAMRRHDA
jgi:hypothetical protein